MRRKFLFFIVYETSSGSLEKRGSFFVFFDKEGQKDTTMIFTTKYLVKDGIVSTIRAEEDEKVLSFYSSKGCLPH
jgi:hypothetical protein